MLPQLVTNVCCSVSFTEWNRQKVIRLVFIHQNYTGMAWFLVGPSQLHSVLLRIVIRQVCVCPLKTGSPLLESIILLRNPVTLSHWHAPEYNITHIRHRVNDKVFRISAVQNVCYHLRSRATMNGLINFLILKCNKSQ